MNSLEIIDRLCALKSITRKKLEKESGVSNGTIRKWNVSKPTIKSAEKLAKYLDVPLNVILGEQDLDEYLKQRNVKTIVAVGEYETSIIEIFRGLSDIGRMKAMLTMMELERDEKKEAVPEPQTEDTALLNSVS